MTVHEEFIVSCNEQTGVIESVKLYGNELLSYGGQEFYVNDVPLKLRRVPFNGTGIPLAEGESPVSRMKRAGMQDGTSV